MEVILSDTKSTLSSTRASRYPGPGVRRRQPTEKDGMSASRISGFLESRWAIMARKASTAPFCISEPRKETSWMVLPSVSITLRKARSFSGSLANSFRRSSETVVGQDEFNVMLFHLNLQLRSRGSSPSFIIASTLGQISVYMISRAKRYIRSPNGFEIHVRLLTKQVIFTPSTFCKLGTIWIELDPPPITPTLLFLKSYLEVLSKQTSTPGSRY